MNFERSTIALAPYSTSDSLDAGLLFLRRHFRPIAACWLTVAVPICGAVYVMVDRFGGDLRLAMVAFLFGTSPLGVLLIAGAAPAAFGEPFTYRGTWRRLRTGGVSLFGMGLLIRLGMVAAACLFIFPGYWLGLRKGFFVEQKVLSHMARHLHDRRTEELLKGELGDLFARSLWIIVYCGLLWLTLFLTLDFASARLLGLPIYFGRLHIDLQYLDNMETAQQYAGMFLWNDPLVVTALLATALAVYPLGRLAWFFCYIDVRVRKDCWDMELQILHEAERLEGGGN